MQSISNNILSYNIYKIKNYRFDLIYETNLYTKQVYLCLIISISIDKVYH